MELVTLTGTLYGFDDCVTVISAVYDASQFPAYIAQIPSELYAGSFAPPASNSPLALRHSHPPFISIFQ